MRHCVKYPIVLFLVALAASVGVRADTTPEARQWLDKMVRAYEKGPFSVRYQAEMATNEMGQAMTLDLTGESTHKDATHMHLQLAMKVGMGGMSMDMSLLQVSDGENVWMEIDNPMLGGKQVMKVGVDQAAQLGEMGGGLGAGGNDPVGQIRNMTDKYDFELIGVSDGRVTLKAEMKASAEDGLNGQPQQLAEAIRNMVVVLDEKTSFPTEMRMGGDPPLMVVKLTDFTYLDSVDDALFRYSPPEGLEVRDLSAMGGAAISGP